MAHGRTQIPRGWPLAYQRWQNLVFINWPVPASEIQSRIPAPLVVDTWGGHAWMTVTPFEIAWVRPPMIPPVPPFTWLSGAYELNVRTYVRSGDEPGVWFFSLDATNPFAVIGGRGGFSLPYFLTRATLAPANGATRGRYRFRRVAASSPAAFEVAWTSSGAARPARADSLEAFLVERYTTFLFRFGRLARARIFHPRWQIRPARIVELVDAGIAEMIGSGPASNDVIAYEQGSAFEAGICPLSYVRL